MNRDQMQQCPVCLRIASLRRFDRVLDIDSRETDLLTCRHCSALLNALAYEDLATQGVASAQATDFYCDTDPAETHEETIAGAGAVIDYLERNDRSIEGKVFCDFGAGNGHVAISAARRGAKLSYACEADTRNVGHVASILPDRPRNLRILPALTLADQPIDILFMWHVLEHLPKPTAFWRDHAYLLAENATVFLQIPLYRPGHVVGSHYVLYSEESLEAWANVALGARPVNFGYDTSNGFLGMIARRG